MFSKRRLTAACLLVLMTAFVAWAASWQIQTKLATTGGTLQVEGKAVQSGAGSLAYNTMADTLPDADVTVTANAGYEIASITKNGVAVADVAGLPTATVNFTKSATAQGLIASFRGKQVTVTGSAVGPGTVTPATATGTAGSSVKITATPATTATAITAITVNGAAYNGIALPAAGVKSFTLSNITVATDVVVTFATATAVAPAPKVVAYNTATTLRGSVSGPGTTAWTQLSGPVIVDTAAWTTATPSFTAPALGVYEFKLAQMSGTTVLASSTTKVTAVDNVADSMRSSCNGCHNPTNGMYPSNSFANWSSSNHNPKVSCVSCHTDAAMPTPVNTNTVDANSFVVLDASAGTVGANYCAKCHSSVTHIAAVAPNNACTRCHTTAPHNPATFFGYFDVAIANMHVFGKATPGTAEGTAQSQYVTQGATCDDCHIDHNGSGPLAAFAESGHGKVSNDPMNAFVHYDWSARTNNGTRQNGNCDRCHTAGGFVKFTGDDAALAARLAPKTGVANNVLVCVTCHTSLSGDLRLNATPAGNRTTLAGGYFALFSSAAPTTAKKQGEVAANKTKIEVQFPGMKNSSICIPCHSGRSTDDVFVAVIDQMKLVGGNYSTVSTGYYQHAANMGQSFIGKGAFNFNSGEYVGANGHAAVKNGDTDTQGPCVGCHYSKPGADHSLEPVGYAEVCQSCHAAPFGATDVEEKKAEFDAGVAVLDALIKEKFAPLQTKVGDLAEERVNVRFGRFGKAAGVPADDATAKKAYGAWYNWQLLTAWDKAAFVHNPTFARTVLMDTIDYLDGNGASLNGSAAATIAASTAVSAEQAAAAAEYIETPACASCHSAKATLVQSGKHAMEVSTHSGSCGRCHTTEGYVAFLATNQNPAGSYTSTSFNGSQNVSCAACHDNHGTVRNVDWTPQPAGTSAAASGQYKLCTSCHNLTDASGNVMASGLTVNGDATVAMQQHYKDWYRNIASTHYDAVATGTVTNVGTLIEGYNVRFNKDSACTDCHGHNFYTNSANALETPDGVSTTKGVGTVQTEWAASGHAGKILKVKFTAFTTANAARTRSAATHQAVMQAGVTAATGQAWEHYDWDDMASRASCQKCHTATGAANFLNNPAGYVAANNNFDHLSGWTASKKSPQNEVLYCWGCHKTENGGAETGELRDPGALTLDYNFKGVKAVMPNTGASNVCFACHSGRTSGENITALTAAGNTYTNVGFQNSHYMAAAGLMYAKIGYTNFIDPTTVIGTTTYGASLTTTEDGGALTSTHRKLGTAGIIGDHGITAEMGLAAGGPCATCHYANGNHELEMGADAFNKVCVNCHTSEGGVTLTAANFKEIFIEEQAVPFKDAIALAVAKLNANYKIVYNPAKNPYFFEQDGVTAVTNWTRGNVGTAISAADAEKLMGACFNINVLQRDPAAYAHARTYARRLLYDSIDFLDDQTINMSTGATALAWDSVKYVNGGNANTSTESYKYLRGYNRTSGAWNALERP